jgi:hypothetical protein
MFVGGPIEVSQTQSERVIEWARNKTSGTLLIKRQVTGETWSGRLLSKGAPFIVTYMVRILNVHLLLSLRLSALP